MRNLIRGLAPACCATALFAITGCSGSDLESAYSGPDPSQKIFFKDGGAAYCGPGFVTIADDDGADYCVPVGFCEGRGGAGDYCGGSPKALAHTDGGVELYSDVLFWCQADGRLAQVPGTKTATITVGGERFVHGTAQIAVDPDRGCVVNPTGHGLRDDVCDGIAAGSPYAVAVCDESRNLKTMCVDNDAVIDYRTTPTGEALDGYNVAYRTDIPCDLDGEAIRLEAGSCPANYTEVDMLSQDGLTTRACVRSDFCSYRQNTMNKLYCSDLPPAAVSLRDWATSLQSPDSELIAGGRFLIECSSAHEIVEARECPDFEMNSTLVEGQCMGNSWQGGSYGCRDATAEKRARAEYEGNFAQQYSNFETFEQFATTFAVTGPYCSDYVSAAGDGQDLTHMLRDYRWMEVLDAAASIAAGYPVRTQRLEVPSYGQSCGNERSDCIRQPLGQADYCAGN